MAWKIYTDFTSGKTTLLLGLPSESVGETLFISFNGTALWIKRLNYMQQAIFHWNRGWVDHKLCWQDVGSFWPPTPRIDIFYGINVDKNLPTSSSKCSLWTSPKAEFWCFPMSEEIFRLTVKQIRVNQGVGVLFFEHIYSFSQFFHVLCLFSALRLLKSLEYTTFFMIL